MGGGVGGVGVLGAVGGDAGGEVVIFCGGGCAALDGFLDAVVGLVVVVAGDGGVGGALGGFGEEAEGVVVGVGDGALVEAAEAVLFVDLDDVAGGIVVGGDRLDEGVGGVVDGAVGAAAEAVVVTLFLIAVGELFEGDVAGGVVAVACGALIDGFGEGEQPVVGVVVAVEFEAGGVGGLVDGVAEMAAVALDVVVVFVAVTGGGFGA